MTTLQEQLKGIEAKSASVKYRLIAAGLVLLVSLFFPGPVRSQPETSTDKTLSPYFMVKSDDPGIDQLPLESTGANVGIAGVIADVKVTQVYKNTGKQAIEAVYVFPASTKASVYGMKMTIGERTIIARIQGKEKARQEYEQAKHEGKSASLLEQQRPNVFQMNVANIMPGDVIKVELSYTELLVPTEGVYEFIYPTVVGPRYSNISEASADSAENWVKSPYLHQGEAPPYRFDITAQIAASIPIQKITSPSHKVNIGYESPGFADIKLDSSEKTGGNRDFILRYRLAGERIESGLLLYPGENENFFLLMMQPPKQVRPALIPDREYIFIVDISGSMRGFPLDTAKRLLKDLIGGLKPTDTFNVLLFAGSASVLSEKSMPANSENIDRAIHLIDRQAGGGGTELLPALRRALALPGDERRSRSIVIATDGYVDIEQEAFRVIRENLGHANMFAFGIGFSVNRFLIEGIARAGMGESFIVTSPKEAASKAEKFRKYIQSPVLTQVKTDFEGFEVYDIEPPAVPDVLAERPVIIFGKWKGDPKGMIRLSGISGDGPYSASIDAGSVKPSPENSALRYLWARHRIAVLSDYDKLSRDDTRAREIMQLGLDYNLLTDFTSFVAIDSLPRNADGKLTTIKQPLPLPQGVSDSAVGGARTRYAMTASPPVPASTLEKAAMPPHQEADPQTQSRVKHETDNLLISGSLSKDAMEKFILEHLKEINRCHAGIKNPISGKLSVKIDMDGAGKVLKVDTGIDEMNHRVLKTCIIRLVKEWMLPAPLDGKPASVEFFLVFTN
jgi:Ca-activated chloride channel family protein